MRSPTLRERPPALARLVLRALAEAAAGAPRPLSRVEADAILALGEGGGTRSLDLGGGLRAVAEYGTLRLTRAPDAEPPQPVALGVPGKVRFGAWEVEARLGGAGQARFDAEAVGGRSSCAPGATATACARSASAGRRRSRTCSRTARCRARSALAPGGGGRRRDRLGRRGVALGERLRRGGDVGRSRRRAGGALRLARCR